MTIFMAKAINWLNLMEKKVNWILFNVYKGFRVNIMYFCYIKTVFTLFTSMKNSGLKTLVSNET